METQADRLRRARIEAGFERVRDVLEQFPKWKANSYKSHDNGNAPFSFKVAQVYADAFAVRPEWLYAGTPPMRGATRPQMARIIGYVGAATDGSVVMETADDRWDEAPLPPGGSPGATALEVRGGSMPGIADDGSLIYFEEQVTKPGKDMMSRVVIVETMDGRVLVKRLLRGSEKGLFDLESVVGPTLEDVQIKWAAHITAVIPPIQAQKIIRRWNGDALLTVGND